MKYSLVMSEFDCLLEKIKASRAPRNEKRKVKENCQWLVFR